jgi:hypothetical protein
VLAAAVLAAVALNPVGASSSAAGSRPSPSTRAAPAPRCRARAAVATPIRVRDLEPRLVIGLLGQPLGVESSRVGPG